MLLPTTLLAGAASSHPATATLLAGAAILQEPQPGAVLAPSWFLPMAAALTTLVPMGMLPILKGMEQSKKDWALDAPLEASGYAVAHETAFAVLEAGPKGSGLFATEAVPKGAYLFDYTGELLTHTEYQVRYPSGVSDYTAATRNPTTGEMHFVDGRDERLGHPSRWMNHDDARPNVGRRSFFPPSGGAPRILMYALRDLLPGDELQWNYGDGYWAAHQGKVETEH